MARTDESDVNSFTASPRAGRFCESGRWIAPARAPERTGHLYGPALFLILKDPATGRGLNYGVPDAALASSSFARRRKSRISEATSLA